MSQRKLYRSREDRYVCGVCGGIGKYLNVDSTVIRLIFAVLCLPGFSGLLLYIIAAIIMPDEIVD